MNSEFVINSKVELTHVKEQHCNQGAYKDNGNHETNNGHYQKFSVGQSSLGVVWGFGEGKLLPCHYGSPYLLVKAEKGTLIDNAGTFNT